MLHCITLDDVPAQPWRNGGGSTQELLAWPAPDGWSLRISVARIDRDGPFSSFPGIDRWFAVMSGAGVVLQLDDGALTLTPAHDPLQFDGALAPGCTLCDGPTIDVNLMLRRDRMTGHMERVIGDDRWRTDAPFRALFTALPATLRVDDEPPRDLAAGSLAWSTDAAGQAWQCTPRDPAIRAWWIDAHPATP